MRRLAMTALVWIIAFASPVDAISSGAALRTRLAAKRMARAATSTEAAPTVAGQPSAEDDERAMQEATVAAAAAHQRRTTGAPRGSRGSSRPRATAEGVWRALAVCESNANPRAVSSSGKYRGAFQFSLSTWQSLGYGGDPIEHDYATQLAAAKRLQARSGWDQWPSCARRLGLL